MATIADARTPSHRLAPGGRRALYQLVWRWHFYAGLLCLPFVAILALTGMTYLFKPQVDAWEERAFRNLPAVGAPANPDAQVEAALGQRPGATFKAYRLPADADDAAMVVLSEQGRDVQLFVAPTARGDAPPAVVGSLDKDARIMAWVKSIHGDLLLPPYGGYLVELVGGWAFVLVATGLYLWFPRTRERVAGVVAPRLGARGRTRWRDLHAVTGLWVSGFVLVLLASGLPWTTVWGGSFKALRAEMGWTDATPQDWKAGVARGEHAGHGGGGGAMPSTPHWQHAAVPLTEVVAMPAVRALVAPVMVTPPDARMRWRAASDTQDRPLRETLTIDPSTGAILRHERFADRYPIDRVVGYGIAWHEGALFGWVNVVAGVVTALALLLMSGAAAVLWWRRRPRDGWLGAPPAPPASSRPGFVALIAVAGLLLPTVGASLLALWAVDRLVMRRRRDSALTA